MDIQKVRIKDAFKIDSGKGRIRIDPDIVKNLNLNAKDVIGIFHPITGKKTAAILSIGKVKKDKGTNIIRIDQHIRRNLNALLDDIVEIYKIEASSAERIKLVGLEESLTIRIPQQIARILENRVINEGDILRFNVMGRRVDFVVIDHYPNVEVVRIRSDTEIIFLSKSLKELLYSEMIRAFKLDKQEGDFQELEIGPELTLKDILESDSILIFIDPKYQRIWIWFGRIIAKRMKSLIPKIVTSLRDKYGINFKIAIVNEGNESLGFKMRILGLSEEEIGDYRELEEDLNLLESFSREKILSLLEKIRNKEIKDEEDDDRTK